ncbi:MAG: transporter [Bacteroidia bacterium]|nr:transporter [Bacteroidia bacterium]
MGACLPQMLQAQTPTDALMMPKGKICVAVSYTYDAWDEYWEGTLKRTNGNIGTFSREIVMPMFALGLTDRINLIAGLPWMRTQASGGQMAGVTGLQDAGLWLKVRALEAQAGPGKAGLYITAGGTLPATNYLADYMPFSLGLGCPDGSLRGIFKYELDNGLYLRAQAGYQLRGTTPIERYYFYTTQGIYSDQVDMPDAITWGGALGGWLLGRHLQAELVYDVLDTRGGFDIRRQDMPFPSNEMDFSRAGVFLHYYLPFQGLGVTASASQVLTGRNVGQSRQYAGGLTWQFGIWE